MSESNGCGIQVVRRELLEALAAEAPAQQTPSTPAANRNGTTHTDPFDGGGNGFGSRLMVERWLQARGVEYRVKPQTDNKGRTVYVLKQCPFDASHGDPDSCIMQEPGGKLSAQCFHDSCRGRGWQDFKNAIGKPDGDHYDPPLKRGQKRAGGNHAGMTNTPPTSPPKHGQVVEAYNDPHLLARAYRDRFHARGTPEVLHYHRQEFQRWDGRAYRALNEKEVKAELTDSIKDAFNRHNLKQLAAWQANGAEGNPPVAPQVTTKCVGNAMQALAGMALLPGSIEPPVWLHGCDEGWDARDVLACRNALLYLPALMAGHPHSSISPTPLFFSPNALDYDFDVTAAKPVNWLAFLDQLWHDDGEAIEALQEWFGYCLLPDTRHHKIFMIVGPRRSGKGTIARVLRALVGIGNTASPTLASLGTNFGLQPLINKTLAIISDARLSYRTDAAVVVERLLSISGEDAQTIDRKHLSALTLKLAVRFMILTNELPKLNDPSGALIGRLILLRQTKSFFGEEDTTLTERLLVELPGILLWAIEGWKRLRERGHFVQPEGGKKLVQQMEDLSSPVGVFLREHCEIGPGFEAPCPDLFSRWETWCKEKGYKDAGTDQTFGRDLRAAITGLDTRQHRLGAMRIRVYTGIRLRAEDDNEDDSIGGRSGDHPFG